MGGKGWLDGEGSVRGGGVLGGKGSGRVLIGEVEGVGGEGEDGEES